MNPNKKILMLSSCCLLISSAWAAARKSSKPEVEIAVVGTIQDQPNSSIQGSNPVVVIESIEVVYPNRIVGEQASDEDVKAASFDKSNFDTLQAGEIVIVPNVNNKGTFCYAEVSEKIQYKENKAIIVKTSPEAKEEDFSAINIEEVGKLPSNKII